MFKISPFIRLSLSLILRFPLSLSLSLALFLILPECLFLFVSFLSVSQTSTHTHFFLPHARTYAFKKFLHCSLSLSLSLSFTFNPCLPLPFSLSISPSNSVSFLLWGSFFLFANLCRVLSLSHTLLSLCVWALIALTLSHRLSLLLPTLNNSYSTSCSVLFIPIFLFLTPFLPLSYPLLVTLTPSPFLSLLPLSASLSQKRLRLKSGKISPAKNWIKNWFVANWVFPTQMILTCGGQNLDPS